MRTRAALALVPLAALVLLVAPDARAHVRVRAIIGLEPATPVTGEACTLKVRFETLTGDPVELQRVEAIAEMSGHAMRPVEDVLEPSGAPGSYRGRMVFSMAGPWVVTIHADDGHGEVTGVAEIEVAPAAAPPGDGVEPARGPIAVELEAPAPAPTWSPWIVLLGALGLVVAAEMVVIARKLARRRA